MFYLFSLTSLFVGQQVWLADRSPAAAIVRSRVCVRAQHAPASAPAAALARHSARHEKLLAPLGPPAPRSCLATLRPASGWSAPQASAGREAARHSAGPARTGKPGPPGSGGLFEPVWRPPTGQPRLGHPSKRPGRRVGLCVVVVAVAGAPHQALARPRAMIGCRRRRSGGAPAGGLGLGSVAGRPQVRRPRLERAGRPPARRAVAGPGCAPAPGRPSVLATRTDGIGPPTGGCSLGRRGRTRQLW